MQLEANLKHSELSSIDNQICLLSIKQDATYSITAAKGEMSKICKCYLLSVAVKASKMHEPGEGSHRSTTQS